MAIRWKYEPWRKSYVREQGSFAQLPIMARALARQLLVYADDDGRIALGGREPVEAITYRAGGSDLGDRRALKKYVPMLLADGYLVREGDTLRIRNFGPAQYGTDRLPALEPVPTASPSEREVDTTETRHERDRDATATRPDLDLDTRTESTVENCEVSSRSSLLSDLPSQISEERERRARDGLGDEVWKRQEELRVRLHVELKRPGKLLALQAQDPGRLALSERIREIGDIDAARERCERVLAVRERVIRAGGDIGELDGGIWKPDRMAWAVARTPEGIAPQRTRRSGAVASYPPEQIIAARAVLAKITERTQADYANEIDTLHLVADRLERLSGSLDERALECRVVIAYCWASTTEAPPGLGWCDKPEMHGYLRPQTLFSDDGWSKYGPPARAWREKRDGDRAAPKPDGPPLSIVNPKLSEGGRR